jgi:hypothetical protein
MNTIFEGLIKKVGVIAVDKVLDDPQAQGFFRNIGKEIGEGIPGDFAEPKINKVVDLIQEGITETIDNKK